MNSEEKSTDNMEEEEEDEEKPFFKAAFDHFDWNHSSTIPTSVRNSNIFLWTSKQAHETGASDLINLTDNCIKNCKW